MAKNIDKWKRMLYFRQPDSQKSADFDQQKIEGCGVWSGPNQATGLSTSRMDRGSFFVLKIAAALVLTLAVCNSVHAQSSGTWNKRGTQAEDREDYDTAYEAYRQAYLKNPKDLRYKTRYERMRFQASAAHVDRGRVLRQSGDLDGAITEFTRALAIDSSNQTAQQEIEQTQKQAAGSPDAQIQARMGATLPSEVTSISGPISLRPISNDPMTLHMVEDTKTIYQAIGKMAGLNVLFDPGYTSTRIPIDLATVSLYDALRIVGTLSGTFWKPVTSNTILVAQNTKNKRQDLDEIAVQTFYLTNASQQNDANEIVTALRNILGTGPNTGVYPVNSQNAIVVRGTSDQLLLVQKLLNDLDRTKPEVVVDVAVLEVNRDKIKNLGITLPQSFSVTPQLQTTTSSSSSSSNSSGTSNSNTSTCSTNGNCLTLNNLAHLTGNDLSVTVGTATVNALLTDSDTRILQNPKIRATDGQKATLTIGSKIPIATGSYSTGAATAVVSSLVNTQFTYIDVGVKIEITPTIHQDREVTLKMAIEISAQNGSVTISSVTEPIITQNKVEQTIQLKEGEPSILAGLIQKQDSKAISGTPGLGELPLLKYFFSSRTIEHQQNEVVFLLIPHIVRESILTRMNTRAIDTGTGQAIELRHDALVDDNAMAPVGAPRANTNGQPKISAATAATVMAQQLQQDIAPQTANPPVNFNVMPGTSSQAVGSTFQVAVMVSNARDLYSTPFQIQFDPKVLSLVNVDGGEFLSHDGQAVAIAHRDEENGTVTITASRPPGVRGMDGQGNLCVLTFKAVGAGDSTVALNKVAAKNSAQVNLPAVGSQAVVHVK